MHIMSGFVTIQDRRTRAWSLAERRQVVSSPRSSFVGRFGERVAWRRHQVRLTQAALAAQLGLGRTQVVQIENGRYVTMRLEVLAALAQALRTSADFLLGLTDDTGEGIPPSPPETPPGYGGK